MTVALVCGLSFPSYAQDPFPADAVVNVKTAYGAKGDGVTNDTSALQNAIKANVGRKRILYFPNGTYLINDALRWQDANGVWKCYLALRGQSESGTVIKLMTGSSGFNTPTSPKAMIVTASQNASSSGGGNEAFRNYISYLTIDTKDNKGAVGIDYLANNLGAMRNVTVRANSSFGITGISMKRYGPGPCLLKNVTVQGFDYGIDVDEQDYGVTMEHISLSGQRQAGIRNSSNALFIRDLNSSNSKSAVRNESNIGLIVLDKASLTGGSSSLPAIDNVGGGLWVRDVTTIGYQSAIRQRGTSVPGASQTEWASTSYGAAGGTSLRLPVEEVPSAPSSPATDWVSVNAYGATPGGTTDDTAEIQAAIDAAASAGKTYVYFAPTSAGSIYTVSGTIRVWGSVRRLMGMMTTLSVKDSTPDTTPIIRFDGTSSSLFIENLNIEPEVAGSPIVGIEHASSKDLILRDVLSGGYRNTPGVGRLFCENFDNGRQNIRFDNPQTVWARQFNCEGASSPIVTNNGGNLWILGFKTEGTNTVLDTKNNGDSEIIGAFLYPVGAPGSRPAFTCTDSRLSVSYVTTAYSSGNDYSTHVKEVNGGVTTRQLLKTSGMGRGLGSILPFFRSGGTDAADRTAPSGRSF